MKLMDFVLDEDIDVSTLQKDLNRSDVANNIKNELVSWIHRLVKEYIFDENKMFKSEYRRYFMDMLKASDFTAVYYKLPKFTSNFIKKNLPEFLMKAIKERYGEDEQILLVIVFFFLSDIVEISCLMGGEFWNFELFKEMKERMTDDMKEVQLHKEDYKKEEYKNEDF